jgi:hypothetical protein
MSKKETVPYKTSIALHPSIKQAIDEISARENLSAAVLLRKLIHIGLKEGYGIEVRGNKVVSN